jgi:hypothetical protein
MCSDSDPTRRKIAEALRNPIIFDSWEEAMSRFFDQGFANWVVKKKRNILWFLKEDTLAEVMEGGCDDGADEIVDPDVEKARAAVEKFFGGATNGEDADQGDSRDNGSPGG